MGTGARDAGGTGGVGSSNAGGGVGGAAGTRRRLQLLAAQRQQQQQRWARPRQRAAGPADGDNAVGKPAAVAAVVAAPRDVTPPRDAGPWAQPPAPYSPAPAAAVSAIAAVPERSPPYAPGLGSTLMVLRRMQDLERAMGAGGEGGSQAPGQQGAGSVVSAGGGGRPSPGGSPGQHGGRGAGGQQGPGASPGGSPGPALGQRGGVGVQGQEQGLGLRLGPGGAAALEEARRRAATSAVNVPSGAALYRGLPEVEAEPREQARWDMEAWRGMQSAYRYLLLFTRGKAGLYPCERLIA